MVQEEEDDDEEEGEEDGEEASGGQYNLRQNKPRTKLYEAPVGMCTMSHCPAYKIMACYISVYQQYLVMSEINSQKSRVV